MFYVYLLQDDDRKIYIGYSSDLKRRIKELFNIEYKNERSLYPYIKTLVDCGLFEVSNVGGKRKWRRKELIVAVKSRKKKQLEEVRALESS